MTADEIEEESEEPGYCPHCAGSGEGLHSDSICSYCHGSGVERDDSGREDYEADRADQINDERKLAGEWE
jgi:DnaJ-class molecular chaperone